MKGILILFPCVFFVLTGCIKKSPKNPEADIITFQLNASETTGNTVIDDASRKIFIYLNTTAYENGVTPIIEISKGGTVSPASGTPIDFDQTVYYTVTSENGANQKTYEVVVVRIGEWVFNFETWGVQEDDQYGYPIEPNGIQVWSSGNPGASLAGVAHNPSAYPTRSTTDGLNGSRAAKLVTLPGTSLSTILGIHLIPGSIFLGDFSVTNALTDPLTATEFGQPYPGIPSRFTGYYKYTPGATFQDSNGDPVASQTDKCAIYAVFYNGTERLNGSNINTSPNVIARAVLANGTQTNGFVHFDIPFTFIPGVTVSEHVQMAIIATSSFEGDQYRGAIGSELIVDSLRIIPN